MAEVGLIQGPNSTAQKEAWNVTSQIPAPPSTRPPVSASLRPTGGHGWALLWPENVLFTKIPWEAGISQSSSPSQKDPKGQGGVQVGRTRGSPHSQTELVLPQGLIQGL